MVNVNGILSAKRAELARVCERHRVLRLSVFGSAAKDSFEPGRSDVDLLVEFETDRVPGLIGISAMELELSELLGGKKVDLRTPRDLSRYFRDEVIRTAEVLYAH